MRLFEKSRVLHWQRGLLRTERGELRAEWIVPAVEGSASLPPLGHYQLPVQSLLVATEPLPSSVWAEIGLERGQAFSEFSRQVTYGQRTADDRLAFGARGGYRFGGKLRNDFSLDDEEVGLRRYLFGELFPLLKDARISHLGRQPRHGPALPPAHAARPRQWHRPLRRLRRRRGRRQQPRRPHPGRADPR